MFDKNNNYIKTYKNGLEASKETGISKNHINSCCRKRYGRKTAGGYIWKYKTEVVLWVLNNIKLVKRGKKN